MKMYLVGGAVRDEIMGVKSNDLDYSVVLESGDFVPRRTKAGNVFQDEPFDVMVGILRDKGFTIFKKYPEHLTVKGKFPTYKGSATLIRQGPSGQVADFVLARKEGTYSDGRRPDSVEPGTLYDDLARRDFSVNAIAKDYDGTYIDPHKGLRDIEYRQLVAVGDPYKKLEEDALRAVRALRFSVTKGFRITSPLSQAMESDAVIQAIVNKISDERIGDPKDGELAKMLRFDTLATLKALEKFPRLRDAIFSGSVSLDSTLKTKGRGK